MKVEIVNPTEQLLSEIANPKLRRKDVAQTFALVLKYGQRDQVDWPKVCQAAVERWSMSGWTWIKSKAWKAIDTGEFPC